MSTQVTISFLAALVQSLPGIMTLITIGLATLVAGPLGFIGAILEVVGASQLLHQQSQAGFWLICIGAAMVVAGRFIPWLKVWNLLSDSCSSGYHR